MADIKNGSNSTFDPPIESDDNTTAHSPNPSLELEDIAIFIGKLLLGAATSLAVVFCIGCTYLYYKTQSEDSASTSPEPVQNIEAGSITELASSELSQAEPGSSFPE